MKKRFIFGGVFFLGLLLLVLIMAFSWERVSSFNTKYDYFYEALDELPETQEIIEWTQNQPEGRQLAENNRYDIAVKITESWEAFAMAMDQGNENLLKDYFAMVALERAQYVLEADDASRSNMILMGMTADPKVYHFDGSVFQFTSNDALFARYLIEGDTLKDYTLTKDCLISNMILRQSGWKISHLERDCSVDVPLAPRPKSWDVPKLKGINYYPKNSPWSLFWRDYDASIVSADLAKIKALGANSVRIFLPVEEFTRSDTSDEALEYLEDFIKKAEAQGIWIIPTLFDFRGELTPQSWSRDRYYLDQVLPVISEAKTLAYVDIKNELDLDEDYQNPAIVEAWLKTIMGTARQIAPDLHYSLGWSDANNALRFVELMDVISYHEYEKLENTQANFERIKAQAGGKPVIISEVGASSYDLIFGLPSNTDKQAKQLESRLNALSASEGVLVWTLYDYPNLDPKAVSGSFWNKGLQKNFGLYDKFDTQKPAAGIFKKWSLK